MRPTRAEVRATVAKYSDLLFFGALNDIPVRWRTMACDGTCAPGGRHPAGVITLATHTAASWDWQATLLHELIHAWLHVAGDADEWHLGVVAHHGPAFTAQCNRVGRVLGLPPVDVDESWVWPWSAMGRSYAPTIDE